MLQPSTGATPPGAGSSTRILYGLAVELPARSSIVGSLNTLSYMYTCEKSNTPCLVASPCSSRHLSRSSRRAPPTRTRVSRSPTPVSHPTPCARGSARTRSPPPWPPSPTVSRATQPYTQLLPTSMKVNSGRDSNAGPVRRTSSRDAREPRAAFLRRGGHRERRGERSARGEFAEEVEQTFDGTLGHLAVPLADLGVLVGGGRGVGGAGRVRGRGGVEGARRAALARALHQPVRGEARSSGRSSCRRSDRRSARAGRERGRVGRVRRAFGIGSPSRSARGGRIGDDHPRHGGTAGRRPSAP